MKELEKNLRAVEIDGLVWGASKLVPLAFGIKKLQVNLVVEDEKVSIDDLQAKLEEDEDHVQSTDVVSHSWQCGLTNADYETLCRLRCKNCRSCWSIEYLLATSRPHGMCTALLSILGADRRILERAEKGLSPIAP